MNLEICAKLFESSAGGTLYAGFSGGADSTAALLAALHFRERFRLRLVAIHFEHGLRGAESRREAEEAGRFAAEHGVEFRCIPLRLTPGPNLEAEARNARLAAWRKLAAGTGAAVVLGHHADDRAENLFLRLARGSNASGLTAMRERSTVAGVTFLRPLLRFRRSEIETFLRGRGIGRWAEDSSNADSRFTRNAVRNTLLPAFRSLTPGSEAGLFRSLEALEADAEFIEAEAEKQFREIAGRTAVPLEFWRRLPPALLIRLLRRFVAEQSGRDYIPNREALARLTETWSAPARRARKIPLDAERSLLLRDGALSLARPQPEPEPAAWNWRTEPEIEWNGSRFSAEFIPAPEPVTLDEALFDADALASSLVIDRRRGGDRMVPFGESAPKTLKKLRTDRGLPADALLPVLRSADGIVWAPGIRHGSAAPVTPATVRIVRFSRTGAQSHSKGPEERKA